MPELLNTLRAHLGARVEIRSGYGDGWGCATGDNPEIIAVLRPVDEDAIVLCMSVARTMGFPLHPVSTGHNWGYGSARSDRPVAILDLGAMSAIRNFDADLGLITIEPGVSQGGLADFLAKSGGRFVAPITGSSPDCSVLANILERGFGLTPIADHAMAATSLTAILPDGSHYRGALDELGGHVSGKVYRGGLGPSVDGLFFQGHFGIVTSITLALARRQPAQVLLFRAHDGESLIRTIDALREIRQLLGESIASAKIMNAAYVTAASPGNDTMSANSWTGWLSLYTPPELEKASRRLVCRILANHGIATAVLTQRRLALAKTLTRVLSPLLPTRSAENIARDLRRATTLIDFASGKPSDDGLSLAYRGTLPSGIPADPARDSRGVLWYTPTLAFRGKDALALVEAAAPVFRRHGFDPVINLTAFSGQALCAVMAILFDPAHQTEAAQSCWHELLETGRMQGLIPYRLPTIGAPLLDDTDHAKLVARLRTAIDPDGVIARHRLES